MTDKFSNTTYSPARNVFVITKDTEIVPLPKALRVSGAGDLTFRTVDSSVDVTMTVFAGEILPFRIQYVRSVGTTVGTVYGLA